MGIGAVGVLNIVSAYRSTFSMANGTFWKRWNFLFLIRCSLQTATCMGSIAHVLSLQEMSSTVEILANGRDFLLSMVVPGTVGQDLYTITKEHYQHANGGLLPLYLFYYMGFFAVPISAIIVACIID